MTNWRVNQKLAAYICIAVVTNFIQASLSLTRESRQAYDWFDWTLFFSPIVLAGLNAWRAFTDQSLTRDAIQKENAPVPTPPKPPTPPAP